MPSSLPPNSNLPVADAVAHAQAWWPCKNEEDSMPHFEAYVPKLPTTPDGTYATYDVTELATVDPRLPEVLPTLCELGKYNAARAVQYTLQYWRDGDIELMGVRKMYSVHHVHDIRYRAGDDCAHFEASVYQLRRNWNDVDYAVNAYSTDVSVPVYWLDQQYPGWQDRLLVGKSLDVPGPELFALLRGTTPVPHAPLPMGPLTP